MNLSISKINVLQIVSKRTKVFGSFRKLYRALFVGTLVFHAILDTALYLQEISKAIWQSIRIKDHGETEAH